MSDNNKNTFDNSWESVWMREINELDEQIKHPEKYSASEINFKKSRKKQLEELIAKRKPKKDLTTVFANGQQNIKNQAAMNEAQMAQAMAAQGME